MRICETDRLVLRHLTIEDAEFMLGLLNQPSFHRFIGDRGVRTVEEAGQYLLAGPIESYEKNGYGLYLTENKKDRAPAGICGLVKRDTLEHADIGFAFLPDYWGKGFAHEAATAVMAYASTELGLDRVLAITAPDNERSIKLLSKLGFELEGRLGLSQDNDPQDDDPQNDDFQDDDGVNLFAWSRSPRSVTTGRADD